MISLLWKPKTFADLRAPFYIQTLPFSKIPYQRHDLIRQIFKISFFLCLHITKFLKITSINGTIPKYRPEKIKTNHFSLIIPIQNNLPRKIFKPLTMKAPIFIFF